MRLIDADTLKEKLCILGEHRIERLVEKEPTVDVLEQIRAEIEDLDRYYDNDHFSANNCPMFKCNEVLQIIDKYKGDKE